MAIKSNPFCEKNMQKLYGAIESQAITIMPISLGCCSSLLTLKSLGIPCVSNPHHANVLLLSGAVTVKSASVVRRIYDQMLMPKYVIAFGSCACSGGAFTDSYAVVDDVSKIIPVDVYISGCCPTQTDVLEGLNLLKAKMKGL